MLRKSGIIIILILTLAAFYQGCTIGEEDVVNPTDPRSKFLGTWKVNEDCSRANYTILITADPGNSTQVFIENFGNPGAGYDPAVGLVVSNTLLVSTQNIGEGWTVSGEGKYQANGTMNWTYSLIISGNKMDCSAICTR